jgi:hypothetical protein
MEANCLEGRFQLVAVSKEKAMLLFDSAFPDNPVPALSKGVYRLRLLGEKANGFLLLRNIR